MIKNYDKFIRCVRKLDENIRHRFGLEVRVLMLLLCFSLFCFELLSRGVSCFSEVGNGLRYFYMGFNYLDMGYRCIIFG